jgi:hypothetical protein
VHDCRRLIFFEHCPNLPHIPNIAFLNPICRIASARNIATDCLIEDPQPNSDSRSIVSWSNGLGPSQIGIKSGPTILTSPSI